MNDPKGYYAILGVPPSATSVEIKHAYRRKAKEFHPDHNPDNGRAEAEFKKINEAYQLLSHPSRRALYDTGAVATPTIAVPEPVVCTSCNKITAQPRFITFWWVLSFVILTQRRYKQGIFCSTCANKMAVRYSAYTWLLGWWGFPWGPIFSFWYLFLNLKGDMPAEANATILGRQGLYFAFHKKVNLALGLIEQALAFKPKGDLFDAIIALKNRIGPVENSQTLISNWMLFRRSSFYIQLIPFVLIATLGGYEISKPSATNLYEHGMAAMKDQRYDAAIQDFDIAINIDPTYADALAARGNGYAIKGQQDLAIKDFDAAIQKKPNYSYAFALRGRAYSVKAQYDLALKDFDEALKISPSYPYVFLLKGSVYLKKREYDSAIQSLDRAIIVNPKYAEAFVERGNAFVGHGQLDRAIEDYNSAIRLKTRYGYAYAQRARAYVGKRQYDLALKDSDEAIEIDHNYTYALYVRGTIHSKRAEYELAIHDLTEVIRIEPRSSGAFVGRSLAYLANSNLEEALADCEQAIGLTPAENRSMILENRGLVYLRQDRSDLAISDFDETLRANPRMPWSLFARGIVKSRAHDRSGRADIAAAIAIQPDVAEELNRFGIRQ